MKWQSMLAIYMLFWAFSVFFVLPFGVRTSQEAGDVMIPGQVESAPSTFSVKKLAIRTTIVATALFTLFILNYEFGWVTTEMLDWAPRAPAP